MLSLLQIHRGQKARPWSARILSWNRRGDAHTIRQTETMGSPILLDGRYGQDFVWSNDGFTVLRGNSHCLLISRTFVAITMFFHWERSMRANTDSSVRFPRSVSSPLAVLEIRRNKLILHHMPGVLRAQVGWGAVCLWLRLCIEFNFSLIIRLLKPPDIFDQQETKAHWLTQGMRGSGPHCAHTAVPQRLKTRAVANWITVQVLTGPLCTSSKRELGFLRTIY